MNASAQRDQLHRLAKSLNCDGWHGALLLGTCLTLLIIQSGGAAAQLALRYDRDALAAGQWWRLLTAHVIHLGFEHALLGLSVLGVDAGLWLLSSTTQWYVGSSGVLHGVLAAGAVAHLRSRQPDGWVLALFLVGKLVYEQSAGALPLTAGGAVIVDAHLYGAVAGALAALLLRWFAKPV
jgi:membrane associated rhomboid family serine protease